LPGSTRDGAVDQDVGHVDALRRELGVERLTEHAAPAHRGGVGVLALVAADGGGGRGDEDRALAASFHPRTHRLGQAEQAEGGETPADLELLERGVREGAIADLGAEVVGDHLDRADLRHDGGDADFDHIGQGGVEQEAGGRAAVFFDALHECVEPGFVAATTQHGVVALPGEAPADVSADARSRTHHETDRFHRFTP
jgi:hypothetical protein